MLPVLDVATLTDLIVVGVGHAPPGVAAQLSAGLGLRLEAVLDCIYRAPSRLLAGIDGVRSAGLAEYLQHLGLEVAVVKAGEPPPRSALFDVALRVREPLQARAVAEALGRFIGVEPTKAQALLLTPPGIAIGAVSRATVAALGAQLPEGAADIIAAPQKGARFALFAPRLSPVQQRALVGRLESEQAAGLNGLALFGLSRERADALWRALCAPDQVRIVNEAFLTADLLIESGPADGAPALKRLAGVPVEYYGELLALAPTAIEEDIPFVDVEARMADYRAAGLVVRAELSSFAHEVVEIESAPAEALSAAGLATSRTPLVTQSMPRLAARVLVADLVAAGGEAWSRPA